MTLRCLSDRLRISPASARLAACVGTNLNHDGIILYEAAAVTGTTLTVNRGYAGTSAQAHASGATFEQRSFGSNTTDITSTAGTLTDVSFERLSLDDFFKRVGAREGGSTELPDAVFHARCVMEVLQLAVTPGLVEKLHEVLPAEFEPLLEGSQGRLERGAGSQPARTG